MLPDFPDLTNGCHRYETNKLRPDSRTFITAIEVGALVTHLFCNQINE